MLIEVRGTQLLSEQEVVTEAFKLAQLGQSHSLQSSLSASSALSAAKNPRLADLIRREQDIGNHINALKRLVLHQSSQAIKNQNKSTISKLQTSIKKLNAARLTLLEEKAC